MSRLQKALDDVLQKLTQEQAFAISREVINRAKNGDRGAAGMVLNGLEKAERGDGLPVQHSIKVVFVRPDGTESSTPG